VQEELLSERLLRGVAIKLLGTSVHEPMNMRNVSINLIGQFILQVINSTNFWNAVFFQSSFFVIDAEIISTIKMAFANTEFLPYNRSREVFQILPVLVHDSHPCIEHLERNIYIT